MDNINVKTEIKSNSPIALETGEILKIIKFTPRPDTNPVEYDETILFTHETKQDYESIGNINVEIIQNLVEEEVSS